MVLRERACIAVVIAKERQSQPIREEVANWEVMHVKVIRVDPDASLGIGKPRDGNPSGNHPIA